MRNKLTAEPATKKPSVAEDSDDDLPIVDEAIAASLTPDVSHLQLLKVQNSDAAAGAQGFCREAQGRRQQGLWLQRLQPRHRPVHQGHPLQARPRLLLEPCRMLERHGKLG